MTAQNPDNARSATKYTGQNYTFTPAYRRSRDPTPNDLRDPLNQGYYPFTALWINKTNLNLWSLVDITNNVATWVLLSGATHPQIQFLGGAGTVGFPVDPTAGGKVTLTSNAGTLLITGSPNTINFDIVAGMGSVTTIGVDDAIAPGTNPVLPTGGGQIDILGAVATASGIPIQTISRAANELNVEVQKSSATIAADPTANGISHYNSAQFTVTADAFVSLIGGPTPPTMQFNVDTSSPPGTDPVIPDVTGTVTITGGAPFATGTQANPIRTDSIVANEIELDIQLAGSNAGSSTPNNFGVSQFDANQFTVTSGFVQLIGSTGPATTKFDVDANTAPGTDPVVPTAAGVVTVTGAQVAAGTVGANVIRTDSLAANAYTIEIQRSTTNVSSDSTKNGVCHFSSTDFTVDADGFVQSTGGFNPSGIVQIYDDFFKFSGNVSNYVWTNVGWAFWLNQDATHPGVITNDTTGAPTGFSNLIMANSTIAGFLAAPFVLSGGEISLNWIVKARILSTPTNRYILRAGLGDNITNNADFTNGIYFEYSDNINGGSWTVKTASAGIRTTNNTATPVTTDWVNLGIVINAAATSVAYTINGVTVAGSPITTNIPTLAIGPQVQVAATVGILAVTSVFIDAFYLTQILTTPR